MQKQIDEVMGLVIEVACKGIDYGASEGKENRFEGLKKLHGAEEAVKAKLRELLPVWQPIDESAPTDGREVLAGFQGPFRWVTAIAVATENHGVHASGYGKFTHWMPLPKAPE